MGSLIGSCDKGLMKFLCGLKMKSRLRVRDKDKWIFSYLRDICLGKTQWGIKIHL